MTVDMFRDEMWHAQLFGKPVLATDQPIPRESAWTLLSLRPAHGNQR